MYDDLPKGREKGESTKADLWKKFKQYVDIPAGAVDSEVRGNMRFQFMFSSAKEANRVLTSLPTNLKQALRSGSCWFEGINPNEGKWQIAWDRVRLSIGEGKQLMNLVIAAGGEIYEAFLT